jgi:hypothetical protein
VLARLRTLPNAPHGNVSDPTACSAVSVRRSSSGTVSVFDVPWIVNTPVAWTLTTLPAVASRPTSIGSESLKDALGYRPLSSRPIWWMRWSRLPDVFSVASRSPDGSAASGADAAAGSGGGTG